MSNVKSTLFALVFFICASVGLRAAPVPEPASVPDYLEDISVTIETEHGSGSGVLFTRKAADGTEVNFVWTAAHVVVGLRTVRDIVAADGSVRTVVEFSDAHVVQELHQDSRRVGRVDMDAEVIKFSDSETGEDLALLRIRKTGFSHASVHFYDEKTPPPLGSELYHVGSLLGALGANSLTTGVISQQGRVVLGKLYDQTTVTAMPGSSGGGVFLKSDGRYIGMLVRGASDTFNLIVPARRIHDFVKRVKIEWAFDPAKPLPSDDAMKLIPVEDGNARLFSAAK